MVYYSSSIFISAGLRKETSQYATVATGPIPWFMMTEMFAQGPRSAAVSVSVVINWLCNFAVGLVFPILQKSLETYSFLPFSIMLLLFFIFTYMFVPETKSKSISEITQLFKSPTMDRSESRNSYKCSKNRYITQVLIIDPPLSEKGTKYYIESSYL
ncbi:solute carrier family 2, facilitated glucose transporter member 2 [Biomphalaria glabrata]|nr:solute carrier family 2, facilitated glucose transporter member 2 [Biomphalaria glabrata]